MPKNHRSLRAAPQKQLIVRDYALPVTVFLTGAAILVVEVIATRLLSPYFGSTIYTVSSVISVVLAALSVGYALGGRLADKRPESGLFYTIISFSGLLVLGVRVMNDFLLPTIGYKLPITTGPLFVSIILFFVPSFFLGMLSPFAVKLQSIRQPKVGVGTVAGRIFFWSTLGSICGSLSAGFVLIPNFSLSAILAAVGGFLIILGAVPLATKQISKALLAIVVLGALGIFMSPSPSDRILYQHDGVYEKLVVYDGEFRGRPTRFFQQDRSSSGAIFLDGDDLVYDYTKYYKLYEAFNTKVDQALVIGGGAYTIPKALLRDIPEATIDVSEIEPSLYDLAKQYFGLVDNPRLHNFTTDGRRFLADSTKKYDYIYSDVYYSLHSIPTHFTTLEFFELAKSKLNENGIFIANVIGDLSRQTDSFSLSEIKTFQAAFPNSYFFGAESAAGDTTQNIIFVGINNTTTYNFSNLASSQPKDSIIATLPQKHIDVRRFELSNQLVLKDDFAPLEHLSAKMLQRSLREDAPDAEGERMMQLIAQQLRYGDRSLNTSGHQATQTFIEQELRAYLPEVLLQTFTHTGKLATYPMTNIIGRFQPEMTRRIVVGTHYDSKDAASLDKNNAFGIMPGANDSASGVAALLELSRYLHSLKQPLPFGIDLVFFDGEEGEEAIGNDFSEWYPIGSRYFADNLSTLYPKTKPVEGIVLDMICDKNLNIFADGGSLASAGSSVQRFWDIGNLVSPGTFSILTNPKYPSIQDDHTALIGAGIPSFLVIDFDYQPFHTTEDTLDKCSAASLHTVSGTLKKYLQSYKE